MDKDWIKTTLRKTGKTTADLASKIQRDRAVVSRIMNGHQLPTIEQAKAFADVLDQPVSEILERLGMTDPKTAQAFTPGFAESDAAAWIATSAKSSDKVTSVASALGADRPGVDVWFVKTKALENMGIIPGDLMLVDTSPNIRFAAGDVVIAQAYDQQAGSAVTLLRRFEPPVLVSASQDPTAHRVHIVDDQNVAIRGKIIASWRLN